MGTIIMQLHWRWISHVIQKENESIRERALHWTPEGRGKHGRPKNMCQHTVQKELRSIKQSWNKIELLAKDKQKWKNFVAAYVSVGIMGSE